MRLLEVVRDKREAALSESWWCGFPGAGLNTESPGKEIFCGGRSEYLKEYRRTNRDVTNQKFGCPCGGKYTHTNRLVHFRSKRHKEFVANNK